MSDRFRPLALEQLVDWAATELERRDSIFGVPRAAFFVPRPDDRFRVTEHGRVLETPFGVAAGPHTQLAQNIVAAWLCGARVIELKTVQALDELEVHKPCIDVTDEGYNVEWSQELRVHESFDEYLRAWVLVHALHRHLGFPGERPGVVFDMSVGYDLAGILQPNVQWYLDAMADASAWLAGHVDVVAGRFPAIREIDVPARIADTVTLSTMHGCPPDEIERISRYLIDERGLHAKVKCNPTLLGAERVRSIVNDELGFVDVAIPDSAFGHDLRYEDALPMFRRLREAAAARGTGFGLKLGNTLEVENRRGVFDRDPTMYLSGRALHPLTVNLAATLADDLAAGRGGPADGDGDPDGSGAGGVSIPFSFAGGADAFNLPDLLAGGIPTVTVCSDLLKTGGYLRLRQYPERIDAALDAVGAADTADLIRRTASAGGFVGPPAGAVDDATVLGVAARHNLRRYAEHVRGDPRYRRATYRTDGSKTTRRLDPFDCIEAPCLDECPVDQAVPRYMRAVRDGDLAEAVRITRLDNPLPAILGCVCDHLCERTCVRTHLDEPLAIRHIKRFIMEHEAGTAVGPTPPAAGPATPAAGAAPRVAIVGSGPAGLAAAEVLARAGIGVTVLEARPYPGGMVGGAIPEYRLPAARIAQDVTAVERLGVEIRYGVRAGTDVTLDDLRAEGFAAVFVAVGAQRAKTLGLAGEDAAGVIDGIAFLRGVREGRPVSIGPRVAVVGAGDTAMDCARTARRLGASVSLVYRRTIDQMPADPEEIHALGEEGVAIVELARPITLRVEDGRLRGLTCVRTEYRGDRDAAGRKVPHDVEGSTLEIPLDTLVVAVSQHAVLDLFGDAPPALTPDGFIATDPVTLATSIPGVFAGGDVGTLGPSSIVRAAADGKRAAAAIAASFGLGATVGADAGGTRPLDGAAAHPSVAIDRAAAQALVVRRARREYRVPIASTPLEERGGFAETTLGYATDEAVREAHRCLDCDVLCSLCVGVCPNMAIVTYEVEPTAAGQAASIGVRQRFQVAVLADLCNECGNCVTACPTAGAPYRDKPRLHLDRADFEAEATNAFLLVGGGAIEGRFDGATVRLEAAADAGAQTGPTAVLATLRAGLASTPHLPSADRGGGTRVPPPGPAPDRRGPSRAPSALE
jgi:putative selenate reductase